VIVDTCSHGDRAYQRTTEPWLKAHKINYQTITGKCSQGSGDASDAAAAISNAVLKFSATGVDLVFSNPIEILLFMQTAQSQGYSPQYLTGTGGVGVEANAPASQMRNFHGFGWMPAVDVNARHQPYPQTPAQKACVAKLAKHGLQPAAYNDFMAGYLACDGLDLYGKALAATGSTAAASIVRGITSSLPSFQGASTYGGAVHAETRQRGGAATYREYGWTDACSCLTYRGRTFPLPNP
jgi:hypothetical protein